MEEEAMADDEDVETMREDLESTKQLLELEVRSKKLLEKDNKRLAQELEKLKMEMCRQAGKDDKKELIELSLSCLEWQETALAKR